MTNSPERLSDLYEEVYGERPKIGAMVTPDGETVYIYQSREKHGVRPAPASWYPLCPVVSGDKGARVEFEIYPDLVIESSPQGLMEVLLVAQGVPVTSAVDTVECFFRILKECGWTGPLGQTPIKIPGDVLVTWGGSTENFTCPDLRPVFSQLRDPDFTGLLEVMCRAGKSVFVNMKDTVTVEVESEEEGV